MLSKLGICSRTQAAIMILAGRVCVNDREQRNPEHPTDAARDRISIDGVTVQRAEHIYIALNKPRGLIVSAADERGRDTIYSLLESANLPWLAPVGRLDKSSEGLLLLSNDPEWASGITDPASSVHKTYHVQVAGVPDPAAINTMLGGIEDAGEHLAASSVALLRTGDKNAWLEVVLDEGRNRHIRRLLNVLGYEVLRLVRVAIGQIALGKLPKGSWRHLSKQEVVRLKRIKT